MNLLCQERSFSDEGGCLCACCDCCGGIVEGTGKSPLTSTYTITKHNEAEKQPDTVCGCTELVETGAGAGAAVGVEIGV